MADTASNNERLQAELAEARGTIAALERRLAERSDDYEDLLRLRAALERMPIGITVTDLEGRIVYTNPADAAMHGYNVEELIGRPATVFAPANGRHRSGPPPVTSLRQWRREVTNVRRDGTPFPVLLASDVVKDRAGRALGLVTSCQDLSAGDSVAGPSIAAGTARMGITDRRQFEQTIAAELDRTTRERRAFAITVIDIDDFETVRDGLGHSVSDELLTAMARRLRSTVSSTDTVAYLGHDEFAVLFRSVAKPEDALRRVQELSDGVREPFYLDRHRVFATVSQGVVLSAAGYDGPEELLRDACTAKAHVRSRRRGGSQVFTPAIRKSAVRRFQMEADLRCAIERREFELQYQPVVSLVDRRLAGVEALVRWHHPERGMVGPNEFIPIAEETGIIVPLGAWVLEEGCRQVKAWQDRYPSQRPLFLNVNLSGVQFMTSDVATQVRHALEDSGLPADSLNLEMTESVYVEREIASGPVFHELRSLGVRLFVDDFGTGYSSLSHLRRFPVHALKIDRSFVEEIGPDDQGPEIVRCILGLARDLDLEVVAEGVRNEAQAELLRDLWCQYGQGYHFGGAVSADGIERILRERRLLPQPQHPPDPPSRRFGRHPTRSLRPDPSRGLITGR